MANETDVAWTNGMCERWSPDALDTFFAPHLSELSECLAPNVPAMPDYYVAFTSMNALHHPDYFDGYGRIRVLVSNFLRRSVIANAEYRDGCHAIREYLALLPDSTATSIHAIAVARFEGCLLQASAAQACLVAITRTISDAPTIYVENDDSPYDRLNKLGNRIRHYHDDIMGFSKNESRPLPLAPIWITNTGLMSRKNTRAYSLTFQELASILNDAIVSARMMVQSTSPRSGRADESGLRPL